MDIYTRRTIKALAGELANWKSLAVLVGIALFFAWLPDGLSALFKGDYTIATIQIAVSSLILICVFVYAHRQARTRFLYKIEPIDKGSKKFKALVIFLSADEPSNYEHIKSVKDFGRKRLPWEIPILAIREHVDTLEVLIIMSSEKSGSQLTDFIELVKRLFPRMGELKVITPEPVDYEDMVQMQERLESIYEELGRRGFKESDVLIDVTGGTKPVSIAGAATTTPYPYRYFQYISTQTKEAKVYNMDILES